jgi:hypothetical protein
MISTAIMTSTVGLKQVEERTYDAVGCIASVTYTEAASYPGYVTETTYSEFQDGKQVNLNGLLCYINSNAAIADVDKTWVVEFEGADYNIVNVDWAFEKRHVELTLSRVENK